MTKAEKQELTRQLEEAGFEVSRMYRINRRWIVTERVEVLHRGDKENLRTNHDRLYAFLEAYDPKTNWETETIHYSCGIAGAASPIS